MSYPTNNTELDCWDERYYRHVNRKEEIRSPSDIDMARIIHSAAFRRLQGKTQILGLGDGDFYRTRLTHSIEVAQIASGIVRQLEKSKNVSEKVKNILPDIPLITAISLAHDIGHPPFGHGGEIALNFLMRKHGGFEGNAQTLRLIHLLEPRSKDGGLNLTRRTLLGLLKYPAKYSVAKREDDPVSAATDLLDFTKIKIDDWKPPKCYYDEEENLVNWILEPLSLPDRDVFTRVKRPNLNQFEHKKTSYKSLDASIMEIADDIAYGVHDLEDAIEMNLLTKEDWEKACENCFDNLPSDLVKKLLSSDKESPTGKLNDLTKKLFNTSGSWQRKDAIGSLVHTLITSVEIKAVDGFSEYSSGQFLRFNAQLSEPTKQLLKCLKEVVSTKVIRSAEVQTLEYRGLHMVAELFQAFITNPDRLLPEKTREKIKEQPSTHRGIADYIAGMTDEYATKMYERLFIPRAGTIYQRL